MTAQHTPGPWRIGECRTRIETTSDQVNPWPTSVACASHDGLQGEADAAFIVRACNGFDDLLAAVEALLDSATKGSRGGPAFDDARALLARVRGEAVPQ